MPIPPQLNRSQPADRSKTPSPISRQRRREYQIAQMSAPRLRQLAPAEPLELILDDPVFNIENAAKILGLKEKRLEKLRQRGQGPEYFQYDQDGVRYELSSLVAFKSSRRLLP